MLKKVYLAIPYTGMRKRSYKAANKMTAYLMKNEKLNVFSPITHSHPMTAFNLPQTWDFWYKIDHQFIDFADELYVCLGKSKYGIIRDAEFYKKVLNSTGVQAEIRYAMYDEKPISVVMFARSKGEYIKLPLDYNEVRAVLLNEKHGEFPYV